MIFGFFALVYFTRHTGLIALVFFIQAFVYKELVKLAVRHEKEQYVSPHSC